jgi:ankyrin repeat protein
MDPDLERSISDARRRRANDIPQDSTDLMYLVSDTNDPGNIYLALRDPTIKATINSQNDDGMTALMYAVQEAKGDIVGELMKNGADSQLANNQGETAIDILSQLPVSDFDNDESTRVWMRGLMNPQGGRRRKTRKPKRKSRKAKKTRKH